MKKEKFFKHQTNFSKSPIEDFEEIFEVKNGKLYFDFVRGNLQYIECLFEYSPDGVNFYKECDVHRGISINRRGIKLLSNSKFFIPALDKFVKVKVLTRSNTKRKGSSIKIIV